MARARNIKPGFFSNDKIAELPMASRLLFIGLWTIADREGRLEDRPKKIKMEIFPADDLDVDVLLADLHRLGFIVRYEVDELPCIQVINFTKHQNPHKNEIASELPEYSGVRAKERSDRAKEQSAPSSCAPTESVSGFLNPSADSAGDAPEEPKGEEKPKTPRRSPETFVPDPFPLEERHYKYAAEKGFSREATELETERFLLWHGAKQTKYSDWYKAWQGWLLRAVKDTGKLTPFQKPESAPKQNDTTDVENFHKHRRLRDRLFNTWEYEDYVLKPGGEERYQADLAKYTALVHGDKSSAA